MTNYDGEILTIRWNSGHGRMVLYLDRFFPCTLVKLRKLLKLIKMDWEHEAELKAQLRDYISAKADDEHKRFVRLLRLLDNSK